MLERLDADGIRRWADLGLAALGRHRAEIDALNVFPVPDGDTGTNLYLTFESAADALHEAGAELDMRVTVRTFAHGALLGARGNSGIILSQLVRGFAEALSAVPHVGVVTQHEMLVSAFRRASESAYAAVAEPREGTVLTVARAAADAVADLGPGTSLDALVTVAADAAADALARTPEQLDVLARAGVVDAGGKGLVVILDALVETVTGVRRDPGPSAPPIPWDVHEMDEGGGAYEVMYLIDSDEAAVHTLRTRLAELGDSVVVVGGAGLWNVHVHADDVGAVIEVGIEAGRPHRIRVTDLRQEAAERRASERPDGRAIVAVAHGPGTAALLDAPARSSCARRPTSRRPRPSCSTASRAAGTEEIVLLPSESDIRPVAEAAAEKARADGIRITVVPTRSIVQTLAAVAVHDPDAPFEDDVVAMTRAAAATRYGGISVASREAFTSAGPCHVGDVLGIVEGDVVEIGETVEDVAVRVLARLLSTGGELVTMIRGDEADDTVAATVAPTPAPRAPRGRGRRLRRRPAVLAADPRRGVGRAGAPTRPTASTNVLGAAHGEGARRRAWTCARSRTCCATTRGATPSAASSPTSRPSRSTSTSPSWRASSRSTPSPTSTGAPVAAQTGSRSSSPTAPGSCTLTFFKQGWRAKELREGRIGLFSGKVTVFNRNRQLTHPDYVLIPDPGGMLEPDSVLADLPDADDSVLRYAGAMIPVYPATAQMPSWKIVERRRHRARPDARAARRPDPRFHPHPLRAAGPARRAACDPPSRVARRRHGRPHPAALGRGVRAPDRPGPAPGRRRGAARRAARRHAATACSTRSTRGCRSRSPAGRSRSAARSPTTWRARTRCTGCCRARSARARPSSRCARCSRSSTPAGRRRCSPRPRCSRSSTTARSPRCSARSPSAACSAAPTRARGRAAHRLGRRPPARRQAMLDVASGEAGIVIGTHALLEEKVQFVDLGLVVVDEQHRFGVEQRDALRPRRATTTARTCWS